MLDLAAEHSKEVGVIKALVKAGADIHAQTKVSRM